MNINNGNYWDRLALIIESLISNQSIKSKSEFFNELDLEESIVADIDREQIELPIQTVQILKNKYNVSSEFLKVGLGPVFYTPQDTDFLDKDDDLEPEEDETSEEKMDQEELEDILKEAIKLSKLDLKNKGHISDDPGEDN